MKTFVFPLLVAIIGGMVLYYITKDKVDVRYTLSENIPLSFYESKLHSENIQQLEIKNSGDVLVKKVIIKINKQIDDYSVKKYAETDSVIISQKNGFEMDYPELPPKGSIRLILKTKDNIISDEDIDINDDKGAVYGVFKNADKSNYGLLLWQLIYSLLGIFTIYNYLIDNVQSRINFSPFEKVLKKKKPFYVSTAKWKSIRKEAIEKLFKNDNSFTLERSLAHTLLTHEKDENISGNEWIEIVNGAKKHYQILVEQECFYDYKVDERMLNLKRPENFDDNGWNTIVALISKSFTTLKIRELRYDQIRKIQSFIKKEKPLNVTEHDWERLINLLEEILFYKVSFQMIHTENPVEYLKKENIQFLTQGKQEEAVDLAENLLELNQFKTVYDQLNRIIEGRNISKVKPNTINDVEWEKLMLFSSTIQDIKDKAQTKLELANKIEQEIKPLRDKIVSQLSIIDNVLNNSDYFDKIESYQNTFNKGNFENLKKLALLNKK